MKQQDQTIQHKILLILASALLLCLFLVGIIQTFSHKALLKKNKQLENKNDAVQSEIDNRQEDENFINDPNSEGIIKH